MSEKENSADVLKLVLFILAILVVVLLLFPWPFWIEYLETKLGNPAITAWAPTLKKFPHEAVATAFLAFLLTQAVQEWYGFKKQIKEVHEALLNPKFLINGLDVRAVKRIFKACVERITEKNDFAEDFLDILENKILSSKEYRYHYSVNVSMMDSDSLESFTDHFHYTVITTIQYESVITADKKEFYAISDQNVYNRQKTSAAVEYRRLTHKNWIVGTDLSKVFDVDEMTIDGSDSLRRTKNKSSVDVYKISFEIPKMYQDGKLHRVSYIMREKILKRGHQKFFHVRLPCYGFHCEIDYSKTDIVHMDCNDMLASKGKAVIKKIPVERPFKIVVDLQNSWVIPGSGIFVSWSRRPEKDADFAVAEMKFPDRASEIRSNL